MKLLPDDGFVHQDLDGLFGISNAGQQDAASVLHGHSHLGRQAAEPQLQLEAGDD